MLKQNTDATAERVIRLLLEPWKQSQSENQHQKRRTTPADEARQIKEKIAPAASH
jgi:hypothetical protein